MKTMDSERIVKLANQVFDVEQAGLKALQGKLGQDFVNAIKSMMACQGHVVVIGMGKSGHIGNKISATLASTGTPAFFVHPGEASHGDLGMITRNDVVIAISNSGETAEVVTIVPLIKRLKVPLIAMTGKPQSTLAKAADVHVDVSVAQEACPLNLAPTSSTTATLVMGDALAIALLEARGFSEEDFAMTHPGGSLGRRLLLKVADLMHSGERLPRVSPDTPLTGALLEMTRKGFGMTAVVDGDDKVLGIYTDGDLRRTLDQGVDVRTAKISDVMTPGGKHGRADWLAAQAVQVMEQHKITALLIEDDAQRLVGLIHMHDLLQAGVV